MPHGHPTGPIRDLVAWIPWRHPFVWCVGSVVLVLSVLPLSWPEFFAGAFLIGALVAVAVSCTSAPKPAPTSAQDWEGYPYREAPRAHARVEWDEVTGEVIEPAHSRELEQGEAVFKAEAVTLNNGRRMIGPGR